MLGFSLHAVCGAYRVEPALLACIGWGALGVAALAFLVNIVRGLLVGRRW